MNPSFFVPLEGADQLLGDAAGGAIGRVLRQRQRTLCQLDAVPHPWALMTRMQSKAQMVERIPVASEVAKGRYAIGFQQVSELLPVPGVTFVGELPDNLQYITRFAGAVTISADHPQEGKALLTYLASPAAQETIHATGMRSVAAAAPVSQKDTVQ